MDMTQSSQASQEPSQRRSQRSTQGVVARKLGDEPSPPKRQRESLQAGKKKLFNDDTEAMMSTFLDRLTAPATETALSALLTQLQSINAQIQMRHVEQRVDAYYREQYHTMLETKVRPKLVLPSTLPFRFFNYECDAMRDVMKKHDVSRYNDTLFVELREQFNRLRSEWHLCGVEKASMKSWVAHERKALRDAANPEPFVLPTVVATTECWQHKCEEFVGELGHAAAKNDTKQHVDCLRRLSNATVEQLLPFVDAFISHVASMRARAIELNPNDVNEQQLNMLRLFHDNLLFCVGHEFETIFGSLMKTLGFVGLLANESYAHALQLLWNSVGLAIHHRRIGHVPYRHFDIGAAIGGGDFDAYVRFTDIEMTTLYYILGYAGSRVFLRFAPRMLRNCTDDYSIAASGIYGNPTLLENYIYALKNVSNRDYGRRGGMLCWPPVDLFLAVLPIARAVYAVPLTSIADANKLLGTVASQPFIEHCRPLVTTYGRAAFGERMQVATFANIYYNMMLHLCAKFALNLAHDRVRNVTAALVQPSATEIGRIEIGKDGAKVLSLRTALTASRSKTISHRKKK